jgi:hypothetical protein
MKLLLLFSITVFYANRICKEKETKILRFRLEEVIV